ncbi:hypothetical protein [Metabacillus sp. FJAT-53654]|uniref:Methanol dehydrogenase n=1 Tax=Metabacillus rhizosphaerae TaxID=3117747 RepID=A0ABZ2MZV1_9BACI
MATFISTIFFITLFFIVIGIVVSMKGKKNVKSRKQDSTFVPPYMIGDSDHRHDQDHHDSNDSFGGFGGDSGGDGGGGGGGD